MSRYQLARRDRKDEMKPVKHDDVQIDILRSQAFVYEIKELLNNKIVNVPRG
jgi:hypothetical protein